MYKNLASLTWKVVHVNLDHRCTAVMRDDKYQSTVLLVDNIISKL